MIVKEGIEFIRPGVDKVSHILGFRPFFTIFPGNEKVMLPFRSFPVGCENHHLSVMGKGGMGVRIITAAEVKGLSGF